jgi:hypothetical protein
LEGEAFLNFVWGHQPTGYRFLARRLQGQWKELSIDLEPVQHLVLPLHYLQRGDLYFCPNAFASAERHKEQCLPSRVMYQDLDEARPDECPIHPDVWWETSPFRYQGLWILDDELEPQQLASLNKALNRACNADPGTWNLTRLLRVPGSYNSKRDCQVGPAERKLVLA